MNIYPLVRRVLFLLEPERAHRLSMALLEIAYHLRVSRLLFGRRSDKQSI